MSRRDATSPSRINWRNSTHLPAYLSSSLFFISCVLSYLSHLLQPLRSGNIILRDPTAVAIIKRIIIRDGKFVVRWNQVFLRDKFDSFERIQYVSKCIWCGVICRHAMDENENKKDGQSCVWYYPLDSRKGWRSSTFAQRPGVIFCGSVVVLTQLYCTTNRMRWAMGSRGLAVLTSNRRDYLSMYVCHDIHARFTAFSLSLSHPLMRPFYEQPVVTRAIDNNRFVLRPIHPHHLPKRRISL